MEIKNTNNTAPLLEVRDLKKYFKTRKGDLHAVDGINFTLGQGKTLGVVGESGCGKSTLGRVLIRLIEATGGEVIYNGKNILSLDNKSMNSLRKELQMVFQDPYASINPRMTVYQTIAEPIKVCKTITNKDEIDAKVFEMMATVGLASRYVNSYPHELDGGRRQRIGVARALVLDPKFIVCDEPVSALDVSIQAQILNLLMDLQDEFGLTYVFISHDLSVVKHISDDIMVMYMGCTVEKAAKKQIFDNPCHPYTKGLLNAIPLPNLKKRGKLNVITGEVSSPINPKPGCRFAARCQYASAKCTEGPIPLKEIEPGHFVACTLY